MPQQEDRRGADLEETAHASAARDPLGGNPLAGSQASSREILRQVDEAVRAMRGRDLPAEARDRSLAKPLVDWAAKWDLLDGAKAKDEAAKIRVDQFAAHCFHRQPYAVRELVGRLVLWLFLFDDAIGEASACEDPLKHTLVLQSVLAVATTRKVALATSPYDHALLDLLARAEQLGASPDWIRRFPIALERFFSGCRDEARINRVGRTLDLEEYRELRPRSVGMYTVFSVCELGAGGQLSPQEARSRDILLAQTHTAQLCAWINDLYSYPKEIAEGRAVNLLMTLTRGRSLPQALEQAVQLYNEELTQFESLSLRMISSSPSEAVREHLGALAWIIHGNLQWTRRCGRYGAEASMRH